MVEWWNFLTKFPRPRPLLLSVWGYDRKCWKYKAINHRDEKTKKIKYLIDNVTVRVFRHLGESCLLFLLESAENI